MGISMEEARLRVASSNPSLSSAEIREAADGLIAKLDAIEAQDNLRAVIEAQAAEEAAEHAADSQRRAEAVNDALAIVRRSNPGWDAASVEMQAHKLVAENEAGIAAQNLRDLLAA